MSILDTCIKDNDLGRHLLETLKVKSVIAGFQILTTGLEATSGQERESGRREIVYTLYLDVKP